MIQQLDVLKLRAEKIRDQASEIATWYLTVALPSEAFACCGGVGYDGQTQKERSYDIARIQRRSFVLSG
jgi:hypothetical protein